jgi:hypothetical protein
MLLALALLLIALNIADAVTTYVALKRVSSATEGNPVMAFLIDRLSLVGALVFKVVVAGGATYIAYDYGAQWVFIVLCALYVLIVYNNVKIIRAWT